MVQNEQRRLEGSTSRLSVRSMCSLTSQRSNVVDSRYA